MIRTDSTTAAKTISYDRLTHDYAASYEGNYIGSFASYFEAERELDHYVSGLMRQTAIGVHVGGVDAAAEVATDAPLLVERTYACMAETCAQTPRHFLRDAPLCCEHYAEATGFACDCDTGPNAPLLAANPPVSDPDPLTCSGCGARILIADYYAILSSTYRVPACCIDTISKMAQRDLAAMGLDIPADDPTPPPWSCMVCETNAHHIQQCDQIRARLFAPTPIDADALLAEADAVLLAHHLQAFNAAYCLANAMTSR